MAAFSALTKHNKMLRVTTLTSVFICSVVSFQTVAIADEPIPPSVITKLPNPLTLHDAVSMAFTASPQQTLVRANLASALALKLQSMSQYYPSLTPSYSFQYTRIVNYGLPQDRDAVFSSPAGVPTVNSNGDTATDVRGGVLGIVLSQRIADTGQRELLNAVARQHVEAASLTMQDTYEQRVDQVTSNYYQLLEAISFVKIAQSSVDEDQRILDAAAGGKFRDTDVDQANVNLGADQLLLTQMQSEVLAAASDLITAIGIVTDDSVMPELIDDSTGIPQTPAADTVKPLSEYLDLAQDNRKDLRAQLMVVEASRDGVRLARVNAGLSLSADYSLIYQPQDDTGPRGSYSLLSVTASFPLLDGGYSRGVVRVNEANLEAAIATFEIDRQAILNEVEHDYTQVQESLTSISSSAQLMLAAQSNYESRFAGYKSGNDTFLRLGLAESDLVRARMQYAAVVYAYYVSYAALQRAAGLTPLPQAPTP